jgi:hypothetical protein
MKMDSAFRPFVELGVDVFRDEGHIPGLADEFVFFVVRTGRDERENRRAVRGPNRHPAPSVFKAGVRQQSETELIHEKPQAPVLIANEDCDV